MSTKSLAQRLVKLLAKQGKTIATCESCTGGLVAGAITSISGSSAVFEQGFITYSNAAKTSMVGVPEYLIDSHGAVSVEAAASMAEGARKVAGSGLAVSITGIAGPTGGSDEKPVGMVCFGLSFIDPEREPITYAQIRQFGNIGRDRVRRASVDFALKWAIEILK